MSKNETILVELINLMTRLHDANKAHDEVAAEVKKMHNEIYAPLCERKKELRLQVQDLNDKIQALKDEHPQVVALAKMLGK